MMYGQQSCSEDGTAISIPFYSDPHCNVETDMNTHGACENAIPGILECTFPPHMTFQSGACTKVISGLVAEVSWRITITDCAGDELSNILAALGGAVVLVILVVCCCVCGGIFFCIKQSQKNNAPRSAQEGGIYATPVQTVQSVV